MKRAWLPAAQVAILIVGCSAPAPPSTDDSPAVVEPNEPTQAPTGEPDAQTLKIIRDELGRAGRLFQQTQFDEALGVAAAAIAKAPQRVEPYKVLSNWYEQLGRHDLAIKAFERFSTEDANGLRFLARHQALSLDADEALATLDRCVEQEPRHAGCRFERASLLLSAGRFSPGVEDLRVSYEVDPDPVTAARLAEALPVTGAYEEAGVLVEAALATNPDSIGLLLARARLQMRDRNDEAAEQTLRRVVELDPTSHVALRSLGGLLLRYGQEVEGRFHLARADLYRDYNETSRSLIQRVAATRNATAALMIAELELTIGDYLGAQRWLGLARAGDAPAQRLAAAQAWTWYALGEMSKGDAELTGAGGPTDGHANLARAARAVRVGDMDDAIRWLQRGITHGPNERSFLRRAADLYLAVGDQDSADALLARAATANFP